MALLGGKNRPWTLAFPILVSFLLVSVVAAASATAMQIGHSESPDDASAFIFGTVDSSSFPSDNRINPQLKEATSVLQNGEYYYHSSQGAPNYPYYSGSDEGTNDDGLMSWVLQDSQGQKHPLVISREDYLSSTKFPPVVTRELEADPGVIRVIDYSTFVQTGSELSSLADGIYESSSGDYQFIYEVWYGVTRATQYSADNEGDVEHVRSPLETLNASSGDCEDLTILLASVIRSSSYTKDWEVKLVYFDAHDPQNASRVNHLALFIDTGKLTTFVESTSDSDGLQVWDKIDGWYVDV